MENFKVNSEIHFHILTLSFTKWYFDEFNPLRDSFLEVSKRSHVLPSKAGMTTLSLGFNADQELFISTSRKR